MEVVEKSSADVEPWCQAKRGREGTEMGLQNLSSLKAARVGEAVAAPDVCSKGAQGAEPERRGPGEQRKDVGKEARKMRVLSSHPPAPLSWPLVCTPPTHFGPFLLTSPGCGLKRVGGDGRERLP